MLELEEVLLHQVPAQPRDGQGHQRGEGGEDEVHADLHAHAEACKSRRAPAVRLEDAEHQRVEDVERVAVLAERAQRKNELGQAWAYLRYLQPENAP